MLSISRRKLAEDLRAAGLADDPQLVNPWHELPIVAGEEETLFDLATAQHQASQQWCERQAAALTRAAERHRGHALRLMFQALIDLRDDARRKLEGWVAVFTESLPVKLRHRLPESTVREFGALYATGRLAIAAGILNWRRERLLRAVTRGLRGAHEGQRPPSIKAQIKELLGERLRGLQLPWKPFKGELASFPTQGYRTHGNNCENWWINAEYFRSWFADRPAEVELALQVLFEAGRLIPPSHFLDFPGVAYVEHQLKWSPRARKKTGFYKLAVGRR